MIATLKSVRTWPLIVCLTSGARGQDAARCVTDIARGTAILKHIQHSEVDHVQEGQASYHLVANKNAMITTQIKIAFFQLGPPGPLVPNRVEVANASAAARLTFTHVAPEKR